MKKLGLIIGIFLLCATTFCFVSPAFALNIAGDYLGEGTERNFIRATGYQFTPTVDITVTSLGIYDLGSLGFSSLHNVGIFLTDGTPIESTTLAEGLSGTYVAGTVGGTRFASVTPFTLTGGTNYYILGDNFDTDLYAYGTGSVSYAPEITWLGFVDGNANSIFSTPLFYYGAPGDLGPNFQYSTVVPEPSTMLLLGFGLVGLAGLARKRIKN